jgi:hypothetical protein
MTKNYFAGASATAPLGDQEAQNWDAGDFTDYIKANESTVTCRKCNSLEQEEAETRTLLEYLYLDVKVRSPDEVSNPCWQLDTLLS